MDEALKPAAVQTKKPRSRVRIAVLSVLGLLVVVILMLVLDTFGPRGISSAVDHIGVLPVCVYDQGDCKPCFGPSCAAQPRGTPGPCFGKSGPAATDCLIKSLDYAQPPQRACRRIFGFMCATLQTGPE